MKIIVRTASILALLFAPSLALAANYSFGFSISSGGLGGGCARSICGIASTILYLINSVLVPLLFAIAFIVFLYGVAKLYIFSGGETAEVEKGHRLILWGIIGFVVMVSLWGLVNVVANTVGLGGVGAPVLPTSY